MCHADPGGGSFSSSMEGCLATRERIGDAVSGIDPETVLVIRAQAMH